MSIARTVMACVSMCLVLVLAAPPAALSADDPGLKGWEKSGPYNKLYKMSEYESFKATVKEIIDVTPLAGMAPGVGLLVTTDDGEKLTCHLGPKSFVRALKFRPGDKVRIRGSFAQVGGQEVLMVSKIKSRTDESLSMKFRLTKDGTPLWTLSADELAQEQADVD